MLAALGPGLITGASDDDPSGIATYSQAGAQFGYALSWVLLFSWPLMAAAQMVSARIGRVTGLGIAGALRQHGFATTLRLLVTLLLVANIINLGADLSAMADATRLLIGVPQWLLVLAFGAFCIWMQVFLPYARTVHILKWLTLSLFAYFATVLIVDVDWQQAGRDLLLPTIRFDRDFLTTIVAVLGTTISPYLFFWQAAEEAEDVRAYPHRKNLLHSPEQAQAALARIRTDTILGMGFSNLVALAILLTTAATLHAHGVTQVQTSAEAAEALRPIAGPFAFAVFALGIIGTGLLAVPVLAGSAAYALGEAFHWRTGLSRKPSKARAFYTTIAAATGLGMALSFAPIDPMRALFWAAVLNGVIAVPIMVVMMMAASSRMTMGDYAIKGMLRIAGWLATLVMGAASLAMFAMMLD
jgi:NRAMP (natural resistance-associated macrophage protein)-like metal ion transporter